MKKIIYIVFLLFSINTFSQDIVGKWKTIDDKRNITTSIFEIYKNGDTYSGKILLILNEENKDICTSCKGKYHNKSLQNIIILKSLVKDGSLYENGNITDPENGKTYNCYVELVSDSKLKIRGYIGFSIFGRTQYWYRVTEEEENKYKQK